MNTRTSPGPVVVEIDNAVAASVDYAWQEALRARAELLLVAPLQNFLGSSTQADQALSAAAARLRSPGDGRFRTVAVAGPRLEVLTEAAADARLLVTSTPHAQGPHGLVSAHRALQLTARAERPLVVVPRRWRSTVADHSVAVGVDGTELSLEAVAFAFETAAARGAELVVIHSHRTPYRTRHNANWVERARLTVSETLAGWDEEYPTVKVTRLLTGRPVVEALAHESENHGLVVLGSHGGQTPLGDPVARRAVAAMTCPVAIVPHHVTQAETERRHHRVAVPGHDLGIPTY